MSGKDVVAQRECDRLRAAGNAQFGQDVADMGFDRGWTDCQSPGDLRIVQPFDHQGQHFTLALRQVETGRGRLVGCFDHDLGCLGGERGTTGMCRADRPDKIVRGDIFEQVADRPRLQRTLDQFPSL